VHWSVKGKDTWKALGLLYEEKKLSSIGVSNFLQHHLEDVMTEPKIVSMVNQMEFYAFLV
jgi:diketogulonate reductase-like aldo/keto reductase